MERTRRTNLEDKTQQPHGVEEKQPKIAITVSRKNKRNTEKSKENNRDKNKTQQKEEETEKAAEKTRI